MRARRVQSLRLPVLGEYEGGSGGSPFSNEVERSTSMRKEEMEAALAVCSSSVTARRAVSVEWPRLVRWKVALMKVRRELIKDSTLFNVLVF